MKDDLLSMAVKIARVIDDSVERDTALSDIAQVQAAVNRPEDALETIEQIRYVDIRADALRKSLDNLQTRFCSKKECMPQLDSWLDKLMEDSMAIPDINIRCPKLHAINLLILSRMEYNNNVLTFLRQSRNEFARLKNGRNRCKFLFAAYQLFQQIGDVSEASNTLLCMQDRISEYKPAVQQGLILGLIAYEFWNTKGKLFALSYIKSIENHTVQSFACLQLVELLAVGGNVVDAQQIANNLLEDKEQKIVSARFIDMGKTLIHNILEMKGVILNINKSLYFKHIFNKRNSDYLQQEESQHSRYPVWFSLSVSFTPKNNCDKPESDSSEDNQSTDANDVDNDEQTTNSNIQEKNWDEYDWDEYDWESVKTKNKEMEELFSHFNSDDEEEEWNESDDDREESWKGSDDEDDEEEDNEDEEWKNSNDEENDDENYSSLESYNNDESFVEDEEDDEKYGNDNDNENDNNDDNTPDVPDFIEKRQKDFLRQFAYQALPEPVRKILIDRLNHNDESYLHDLPMDIFFFIS